MWQKEAEGGGNVGKAEASEKTSNNHSIEGQQKNKDLDHRGQRGEADAGTKRI